MILVPNVVSQSINWISRVAHQLFSINPTEPFKSGVKVATILGVIVAIFGTLASKTFPWLRAKWNSRSLAKCLGSEFPVPSLERAIRHYVRPWCQDIDPAGAEEPRLVFGVQQSLFEALDKALTHPIEYHFVILLADSGMGKTSALINYYARHLKRWRRPFRLVLIPLGIPDADDRIAAIKERNGTVLFLDALDEDTLAIVDHVERLSSLLRATRDFERVLISCRTQFFSKDEEIPKETGKIKVGSRAAGEPAEYLFHKIYLSPFTDKQVSTYLKKRYPFWRIRSRQRARAMIEKIPQLSVRPMLLAHVDDLVRSKRNIQYSYELYEDMIEAWLMREQGFIQKPEDLRQFSERLAVDIFLNRATRGSERIKRSELAELADDWNIPLDDWKLSGRSLLNRDAGGNYKFAHRSIMEYLFIKRFLSGEKSCGTVEWTDQMVEFYMETLENRMGHPLAEVTSILTRYESDPDSLVFLNSLVRRLLKQAASVSVTSRVSPSQLLAVLCFELLKSDAPQEFHIRLAIKEMQNTRSVSESPQPFSIASVYYSLVGGLSTIPPGIPVPHKGSVFDERTDATRMLRSDSETPPDLHLLAARNPGFLHIPVESEGIVVGSLSIFYSTGSSLPLTEKQWRILQTIFNPSNRWAVSTSASEVFEKKVLRAFVGARRLAAESNSLTIEPKHLFFALFREDEKVFRFALLMNDASIKKLRQYLRADMPRSSSATIRALPFSDSLKRVLDFARQEALGLHDEYIRSQHLLTALLNQRDPAILNLLSSQGSKSGNEKSADS